MREALYTPSPWQLEFHRLNVDEALGAGAAGVGKTRALLMDAILCQAYVEHDRCLALEAFKKRGKKLAKYGAQFDTRTPEQLADRYGTKSADSGWDFDEYALEWGQSAGWSLHLRRELLELQQTIAISQLWFAGVDAGVKWDSETKTHRFRSGFRYQFGHCKDPNDHNRYLSSAYTHIAFDELTTFAKSQYDAITLRLRSSDPVLITLLRVRCCSNPGASPTYTPEDDSQWVRKMFVDPYPQGRGILSRKIRMASGAEVERTRVFLPGRLTDNPDPEFKRTYEIQVRDKPKHLVRAYLDGDWDFVQGAFFGEDYDPAIHTIATFRNPADWVVFRMMDWGYKTNGVVLWASLDEDENMRVFEEFWFKEMFDRDVAMATKRIELGLGLWDKVQGRSRITGPADTQIWEERGDSAQRKIDVFMRLGVPWVQADKKSREDNAQRVMKRLKMHVRGIPSPSLMISSNCPRLIRTMRQIPVDPHNPEEPKKGGSDHGYDALSYGVAYAAAGRSGMSMLGAKSDWADEDDKYRRASSSGLGAYGFRRR